MIMGHTRKLTRLTQALAGVKIMGKTSVGQNTRMRPKHAEPILAAFEFKQPNSSFVDCFQIKDESALLFAKSEKWSERRYTSTMVEVL